MTMASRIGVIEGGRLLQMGTPREIYENPINAHVAARLGQPAINLLPAALFAGAPAGARTVGRVPSILRSRAAAAMFRRPSSGSNISATRATSISTLAANRS